MKRMLVTLLLTALILTVPAAASGADPDLSAMSYDALMGLKERLEIEISTRPEAGERVLQRGQYVVGRDIAQGIYDVGFVAEEPDDTYTDWYVYDTKQMYDYDVSRLYLGDMPRNEGSVRAGSSVKVELFDGDYFVIRRSAASIVRSGNAVPVVSDYAPPQGASIPAGIYTVGVEIPEGTYTMYYNGKAPARARTYADPSMASNDFADPEFEVVLADYNTSSEIYLKEGYAFRLEYNNIIMKKSQGFVFD